VKTIVIAPRPRVEVHLELTSQGQGVRIQRISLALAQSFNLVTPSDQESISIQLLNWLIAYSKKDVKSSFLAISPHRTDFGKALQKTLQSIPFGETLSYQEVALKAGSKRAARAVGNFCRSNLFPLVVPCHRVLPSHGGLGSFTPDRAIKKELLDFEGFNLKQV
jgi:O-6-methylguanine DNA methyltransferase